MRIKLKLAKVLFILCILTFQPAQAQHESGFEGVWVGVETLTPTKDVPKDLLERINPPHESTIVILEGGKVVGRLNRACLGRYNRVHREGDALTFGAGDCGLRVILSNDGKTLTEQGSCNYAFTWAIRSGRTWPISWVPVHISGTFQRSHDEKTNEQLKKFVK